MPSGNIQPSLDVSEHIGTPDGENINAKRVGMYVYNPTTLQWSRFTGHDSRHRDDYLYRFDKGSPEQCE